MEEKSNDKMTAEKPEGFRKLPFDVARCCDIHCPEKMDCLRFLNGSNYSGSTPFHETLMKDGKCEHKIPVNGK